MVSAPVDMAMPDQAAVAIMPVAMEVSPGMDENDAMPRARAVIDSSGSRVPRLVDAAGLGGISNVGWSGPGVLNPGVLGPGGPGVLTPGLLGPEASAFFPDMLKTVQALRGSRKVHGGREGLCRQPGWRAQDQRRRDREHSCFSHK